MLKKSVLIILSIFSILICFSCNRQNPETSTTLLPRPEHPRPDMLRDNWMNLNGIWEFAFDPADSGLSKGWNKGITLVRKIVVPFCPESALSGIHDTTDHQFCWYARYFNVSKPLLKQRLLLHFGAVDYRADVWLNGMHLGRHEGGYEPFSFDITKFVKRKNNRLVVRVHDDMNEAKPMGKQSLKPSGCIYTRTTGIWQTVWLEGVGSTYISGLRTIADPSTGIVNLNLSIDGSGKDLEASVSIRRNGEKLAGNQSQLESSSVSLSLTVPHPEPWNTDNPVLYDLDLIIRNKEGKEIDHLGSYIGFRKVSAHDGQIFLNEKPFFLISALDQGFYPEGLYTPPTDEDLRGDVEWAKKFGLNSVRKHQIVADPRFYYWCDKLGLTVWGEMPDWGADKQSEKYIEEWKECMNRDFNHPCIITWVPGNEWTKPDDEATNLTKVKLYNETKALDPTRLVIDNSGYCHTMTDITDLHVNPVGINGADAWDGWVSQWQKSIDKTGNFPAYPDRPAYSKGFSHHGQPVVISEVGNWIINEFPPLGEWKPYGYPHPFKKDFTLVQTATEYLDIYRDYFLALMSEPAISGFSYVQLYDVEGEVNGYMTYDRRPKVSAEEIAAIHSEGLRIRGEKMR